MPPRFGDALGLVVEQHRVAVERDAQLIGLPARRLRRQDRRGRDAGDERLRDAFGIGRQEQVRAECVHVRQRRLAARERRAHDVQAVVLDRIEDAKARVGGVARQQDHLDMRRFGRRAVQAQQLLHERKRDAGREQLVLARDLVARERIDALALEQRVALAEIEQRARRDRDDERAFAAPGVAQYHLVRARLRTHRRKAYPP